MYFTTSNFVLLSAFASTAFAHMELTSPAPFRSKVNPNVAEGQKDFDMTTPLSPSGSNFPCKGYQVDFGTPAGKPTATYEAGSQQSISVAGGAPHNGGSCQISLSYDGGATFKVIQSILGSCPLGAESFGFTVPADAAAGDAILSWSWFNKVGNREMYQNCAAITITGSGTNKLQDLPDMFVANVGNGCTVPEGTDVEFPNPGANVERKAGVFGPPTGQCGPVGPAPAPAPAPAPTSEAPVEPPVGADPTPSSTVVAEPPVETTVAEPPVETTVAEPPVETTVAQPPVETTEESPVITLSTSVEAPAVTETPIAQPPTETPPTTGNTYTVVDGDICLSIAEQTGVTADQLIANNPAINAECTNLEIGQVLNLRRRSRIMRDLAFVW